MRRLPNQKQSIALTIMGDIDGRTRSENGESTGVIKAGGVRWAVLDLRAETERVSIPACLVTNS